MIRFSSRAQYYVAPEERRASLCALFLEALTQTKYDAVAKIGMHNREHTVIIRPVDDGLVLHTLYYAGELNKGNKAGAPHTKFTAKELELAKSLVSHLAAPFKPEHFHDTNRENVERLIAEKKKGKKITTVEQPRKAPVIDLMEALKRSLKGGGPPESASPTARPSRARTKTSGRRKAA